MQIVIPLLSGSDFYYQATGARILAIVPSRWTFEIGTLAMMNAGIGEAVISAA
jgi:hypothetical protein